MKKSSLVVALLAFAATAHANVERSTPPPAAARKAIEAARAAIDKHDFPRLASLMSSPFRYGAHRVRPDELVGDWRKDASALDALTGALADCRARTPSLVACPLGQNGLLPAPELRFELQGGAWRWTTWNP